MSSLSIFRPSYAEQLKLALVLVVCSMSLTFTDWLWDWDQNFYDIHMRAARGSVPDDIVIIAIDENSLNYFGRWPWPREIHARLIDQLTELGARSIVLDIILSERDQANRDGDSTLAKSIKLAGNVVLPILMERVRSGGQFKETLPLSMLIEAGAGLGHVHVELDPDGIARSIFLYEGLGTPHWPHISLLAFSQDSHRPIETPLVRTEPGSPFVWTRAEQRWIPFLGPPGYIERLSYLDVVQQRVDKSSIVGKTVFVGVTASGLGDGLPTPVSGLSQPMPGIEINANIYAAVANNRYIMTLSRTWRIIIIFIVILIPVIFYSRISPRAALILNLGLILGSVSLSFLLLYFLQIWFAPLALILTLVLSYVFWSWRRLETTTQYLNAQIELLSKESVWAPDQTAEYKFSSFRFISEVLACDGWVVYDADDNIHDAYNFNQIKPKSLTQDQWIVENNCYWLALIYREKLLIFGLKLRKDSFLSERQHQFLEDFRDNFSSEKVTPRQNTMDLIEHQILRVQSATDRLRAMRSFISNSLDQMADAIIIISSLGEIVVYNQQAERLFGRKPVTTKNLLTLLSRDNPKDEMLWRAKFSEVLAQRDAIQFQVSYPSDKDLLIKVSPLIISDDRINGFIVSFSDITDIKNSERKRDEYINFLSHDLRSPISSALALIELTMDAKYEIQRDNIIRLKQYTERALGLTENFVQIARADNIDEINFLEIDLLSILLNASDQLWELAHKNNIVIEFSSSLETAECIGDATLLERAIMNVLGNAIKYSSKNTTIMTTLEEIDNYYYCKIIDQGYGIEKEEIAKIFSRFYRSESNKRNNVPGYGLGLAFVKAVIERHHGRITVESELNKGTIFCLTLPTSNVTAQ